MKDLLNENILVESFGRVVGKSTRQPASSSEVNGEKRM